MQHKHLFLRKIIDKTRAGGSAMVEGNAVSSNKGAPADENTFTEQGSL